MNTPGASHHVDDSIHENKGGDSRYGSAKRGSSSQEISHSSFNNDVESVDCYGRILYIYQNNSFPSHHSDEIGG